MWEGGREREGGRQKKSGREKRWRKRERGERERDLLDHQIEREKGEGCRERERRKVGERKREKEGG